MFLDLLYKIFNFKVEMDNNILVYRVKTPDGTILESLRYNDCKKHEDKITGEVYMVDGGPSVYRKCSINSVNMEDLSLYTDSDFEEIRKHFKREIFFKDGESVLTPLKDMTESQLFNFIMDYKERLDEGEDIDRFTYQYIRELAYRYDEKIKK